MSKSFTVAEVSKHKTEDSGQYIIVDNGVYDITGNTFPFFLCIPITLLNADLVLQPLQMSTLAAPRY